MTVLSKVLVQNVLDLYLAQNSKISCNIIRQFDYAWLMNRVQFLQIRLLTYIWSWRRWTSRHRRTTCLLFAWTHTGFHLSAAGILLLPPLFPHKKRRAPYHYHLFFSWLNLWCLLFKERRIIGTSLCARSVLTEPIWDKIKEVIRKFALKKDDL